MRILIVEDEHKIANSIKKGLELESFAVDVAFDGTDGFDLASTENYDVIVLDLMLPGMSGMEIVKKLRSEKNHTPILILTAKGELDEKISGLNSGADDYLVKPFAFAELSARIKALTRRPKDALSTKLIVEDLELDTTNFEVTRSGQKINLSRKEYSLLEYMMRNTGKTITKDNIISSVWSYESDILPNTVEVYIGYLRSKIDKPFKKSPPLIHTNRGFGYMLGKK